MDSLSQGLKCVVCVLLSVNGKDASTDRPVQDGVDGARAAVVISDGQSLCVEHLHERMTSGSMADYLAEVEKSISGRRCV